VEVVNKMKSARFVHLAPHGLSEEYRNGEIPGAIPLAPSSTDDGFLTASEIVTMRLNAEMVVLSACKTGQGLLTGDGQTEPNKAKAIRHAMLANKTKYPDPLNWAAFTLIVQN